MLSLTITVSISRNSPRGPVSALIPIIAEMGKPMYSAGKSDAETEASAAGPPRHVPSDAAATATSAVPRHASSTPSMPLLPTTTIVAKPADAIDTSRPLARASETSSLTASPATATATAKNSSGGANHTTPIAIAMSTAPLSTRVIAPPHRSLSRCGETPRCDRPRSGHGRMTATEARRHRDYFSKTLCLSVSVARTSLCSHEPLCSALTSLGAERHRRRLDAAVAAFALLVGDDSFQQIAAAEVGPQRLGDPDLGVGDLPQEEIAHAHLAAGPDQQIRIRLAGGVEEFTEAPLVEIVGAHTGRDGAPRRVDDLGAPAIVQRDVEHHAGVPRRLADADLQLVLHVRRQLLGSSDDAELDVVIEEGAELQADIPLEQHHQRVDLGARPLPVLDRKRIKRQHVDAEPRRRLDDVADRVDAGAMPFDARQVPLRCPSSVAVHDDGDVGRQQLEVDLARQRLIGRSRRNRRQELLKRHYQSFVVNLECTSF